MLINFLILIVSLIILSYAANYLVNSGIKIARKWNVSELFIGLTLVAMGTSAPEIAVSANAALKGVGDLSVGNVIGSNIFNLGIILGLVGVLSPIIISKKILKRDSFVLLFATVLVFIFMLDLKIVFWESLTLLILLFVYLGYLWYKKDAPSEDEDGGGEVGTRLDYLIFFISLIVLIKSSDFVVSSAIAIAEYFKVSEWAIGATIVAAGTSLPEVAVSVAAALKKKFGLSVGNVIGSDIFNTFGVIGISGLISQIHLKSTPLVFSLPAPLFSVILLIATLILVMIFMQTRWRISRTEGAIILVLAILRMIFEVYVGSLA